ncbi:MAG TPA: hypothetical protein VJV78_26095, partial [Polyangiales bacterium]|nr:hypothetical protein [Polyangiales bacterium]
SRKTRFRLVTSPWPGRVRTCKVPQMVSPAAIALGSSISEAFLTHGSEICFAAAHLHRPVLRARGSTNLISLPGFPTSCKFFL